MLEADLEHIISRWVFSFVLGNWLVTAQSILCFTLNDPAYSDAMFM